ncbi:unnamed protein product [Tilletia controversa]|uniref:Thioredoxin domain-containing protein n=1 Tax=Tilletia controversa TaxID=13291 RepID=A0A8X7MWG7_9BASI|nr:hypothetical protein CF328_g1892 [Tilletia controversa]KAE8249713.1 hypothetical protein A4X06_0g3104 [Tilletia controversa]CAD6906005.1 unnamed protein product [Tilletia controversa]CAD6933987.1 unnamed protein product [Tilletia controversa]CAD6974871.1 unnamed protein product [Tilletia controversa]
MRLSPSTLLTGSALLLLSLPNTALASNVADWTKDPESQLKSLSSTGASGPGPSALVEFFAPWCGHCKNLAPIYEQLADGFAHEKDRIVVAKVDADSNRSASKTFDIAGFPTLKLFEAKGGNSAKETYQGPRSLESLAAYINEQTGAEFYAPQCGPFLPRNCLRLGFQQQASFASRF